MDNMTPTKPIIIIEGSRNTGKTFLIEKVKPSFDVHKFPFADYYKHTYGDDMSKNNNKELFYFTAGYDVTLFDMYKNGLVKENLLLDRGFLSNLVFGIQSGRVSPVDALKHMAYIKDRYIGLFHIIYIETNNVTDNRDKDMWVAYDIEKTNAIYELMLSELDPSQYTRFTNNYDEKSVDEFFKTCLQKNRI